MKLKGRKIFAFVTTWVTITGMGILTIIFAPQAWPELFKWWLGGLLVNALGFISLNIIKSLIISKNFHPEMWGKNE